jgi:hypothetical protein
MFPPVDESVARFLGYEAPAEEGVGAPARKHTPIGNDEFWRDIPLDPNRVKWTQVH